MEQVNIDRLCTLIDEITKKNKEIALLQQRLLEFHEALSRLQKEKEEK
jgi:hypothetical protein